MPALTQSLWERYRATGDPEARTRLLDGHLGLVHHCARELAPRAGPGAELDELISAGTLGLIHAIEAFDPARGLAFSTFAVPRIRGAILDELRALDWAPRTVRARTRQLAAAQATLQQRLGRAPRPQELADALGLDLDEFWRWREDAAGRSMVGFDERVNGDPGTDGTRWRDTIADEDAVDPGHAVVRGETLSGMREAMAALAEKDRTVLALYYYENLNLRQIGEVLHVTESRVSQIRTRALQRLRQALAADEED